MNDQLDEFITMPHDATASQLEMLFASRADIFGRPSVSRVQNDHEAQAYTWSVTFQDYAGSLPLLQRVGGVTDTYGRASVSYTRSANSVGLISRCRCCSRAIDVSAIIDVRRRL